MGQPLPPPPYQAPGYSAMQFEGMLTRRNVFFANALGLFAVWVGILIRLSTLDSNLRFFGGFLVISGALLAAVVSVAGALGSKRTSDLQNLGLLLWAGILFAGVLQVL